MAPMTLQQRLHDLDARAWLMERQLEEAEKSAAILRGRLAENRRERAAFAAVDLSSALPDDVLKLIFEEVYEHKFYDNCSDRRCIIPLAATYVSRRWRAVALSLPRLWRCLHIHESSQKRLELSIERSRQTPLFLTLDGWDYAAPGSSANEAWIRRKMRKLSYILQRTPHIARIRLVTNVEDLFRSFMADMAGKVLPSLEYMSLSAPDDEDEDEDEPLPFTTISLEGVEVPNLMFLRLAGNIELKYTPTSLAALETLVLSERSLVQSKLVALAEAAPQLVHLSIDRCRVLEVDSEAGFVHFPKMRSLTVIGSRAPFSYMSLPALASVTVASARFIVCHPPSTEPEDAADHALSTARTLTLVDVGMFYDEDDDPQQPYDGHIFTCTPRVATLALRRCTEGVAPLLEHFATAVPLTLPVLEVLELTAMTGLPQDLLLRIVRHRAKHDCPLREVRLGDCMRDELGEDMVKLLEENVCVTLVDEQCDLDVLF